MLRVCLSWAYQLKALRKGVIFPVLLWETLVNSALTFTTSYTKRETKDKWTHVKLCKLD